MKNGPQIGDSGQGWLKRLFPLISGYKRTIAIALIAAIGTVAATSATPVLVQMTVDRSLVGGESQMKWLGLLAGLAIVRFIVGFIMRYYSNMVSLGLEFDLRTMLFEHLQSLDLATHDSIQTGQLVSRANSDVRILQMFLSWMPVLWSGVLILPIAIVFMAGWHLGLTVLAVVPLPLVLLVAMRMREKLFPASWENQQRAADIADVVDDAVTGVRVVRAFGQEQSELTKLRDKALGYFRSRMRMTRFSARYTPLMMLIPGIAQVLVLLVGGMLIAQRDLTMGKFIGFNAYILMLVGPIQMFGMFLAFGQRARASGERILEVFDSSPTIFDAPEAKDLVVQAGEVSFQGVRFGYVPSEPVLKGLDFTVAPGERVAIVGGNRSGKSTLTTLLPRFYDPQQGAVRIDGQDLKDVTLVSLRRQVGLVFEDSFLFSGTIRDNIAYGREDATDEEIARAARAAGAEEFISSFPDGLDTEVGEAGIQLSGGQRQRLALARALLGDPKIMVLDDATSSVDVKTEEEILDALADLLADRTTILVASRPSTVALADRIVVLDEGAVVETGTHEELMDRSQLYRELMAAEDGSRFMPGVAASLVMGAFAPVGAGPPGSSGDGTEGGGPDGGGARRRMPSEQEVRSLAGRNDRGLFFSSMPATPELLEKVSALPEAQDDPKVELLDAAAPSQGFRPFGLVKKFAWVTVIGVVLLQFATLTMALRPKMMQWGVDGSMSPQVAAGILLVLVLGQAGLISASMLWTMRVAERALYFLRIKVFSHLQRISLDFYEGEMAGRIMTRMTSDIDSFGLFVQEGMFGIFMSGLTLIWVVVALFFTEVRLAALVCVLVLPTLYLFVLWFQKASDRAYLKVRDKIAAVLANLQEGISGIRVTQAFVQEKRDAADFRQASMELLEARKEGIRYSSTFFPGVDAISVLGQAVVIAGAGYLISSGQAAVGIVLAFVLYLNQFFIPLQQLSQMFDTFQQAKAAATKLDELLERQSSTPPPEHAVVPDTIEGKVVFDDVKFAYFEGKEVLHGVDLEVPSGQTIALVGKTGAGKSTLIKLAARFYDPTGGRILIDGYDLREIDPAWLRRVVGLVPQEPFLFAGSIRSNIVYGKPEATYEEIERAARLVGAHEIIEKAPQGYDANILGRGRGLSAGERQLIALARVALHDPRILLLDEPTSRLDLKTEAQILQGLDRLLAGRTAIIIAHRLSTVRGADRIAVMDEGRIAEFGSHDELLESRGLYAELHDRWLGKTHASPGSSAEEADATLE